MSDREFDGCSLQCISAESYVKLQNELTEMSFEDLLLLKEKLGTKAYNETLYPAVKKSSVTSCTFSRENKNRPMEMSSKVQPSALRTVVSVKQKVRRDPRFDDLSGTYQETHFTQAYQFILDVKQREKQKLLKRLKHEKNPERRERIDQLIKTMTQKEKDERIREERLKRDKERKVKEKEAVAHGKKPFFLKKSEKKKN